MVPSSVNGSTTPEEAFLRATKPSGGIVCLWTTTPTIPISTMSTLALFPVLRKGMHSRAVASSNIQPERLEQRVLLVFLPPVPPGVLVDGALVVAVVCG